MTCASCATADEVARLVRAHYGLPPTTATTAACDHDQPVDAAALAALLARTRMDFDNGARAQRPPEPPPDAGGQAASPVPDRPQAGHSLDEAVLRWADELGVAPTEFRAQRRAFIEGRLALGAAVTPAGVARAALPYLHRRGVLPADRHRVVLIRGGQVGSHAVPVRLPGESLVVVPGDAGPLCAQYVMHELGHVIEHANRRRGGLPERFAFDPGRSEGIALLLEGLAREPDWWDLLGIGELIDDRVIRHLRAENAWSQRLAEVVVDPAATAEGAWSLTADELALHRRQADYWRALVAGRRWAARIAGKLADRHGARWWRAAGPWDWMVATDFDEGAL